MRSAIAALDRFHPNSPALAMGRSLIAASQLLVVLINPDRWLFVDTVEYPTGMKCAGPAAVSLWCLTESSAYGALVSRTVVAAVLVAVVVGWSPRWTCVPHCYAAFSLAVAMPLANGGDRVGQIATALFIPMCLCDDRVWQWSRVTTPGAPWWRGSAFAAHLVLRVQLAAVYVTAVVSKLSDPVWRGGGALYYVLADPRFGLPREVWRVLAPVLESYWVVAGLSWSVILSQAVIAWGVLGTARLRSVALWLGLGLHAGIAVLLSLPVFGLVMTGVLLVCCSWRRTDHHDVGDAEDSDDRGSGGTVPAG